MPYSHLYWEHNDVSFVHADSIVTALLVKVNAQSAVSVLPVRTPRPRALDEQAWQEALKAKTEAISVR